MRTRTLTIRSLSARWLSTSRGDHSPGSGERFSSTSEACSDIRCTSSNAVRSTATGSSWPRKPSSSWRYSSNSVTGSGMRHSVPEAAQMDTPIAASVGSPAPPNRGRTRVAVRCAMLNVAREFNSDRRGMTGSYPPIGDYALLSDCHSAALVSRDGSIDWCCFDRFDARPVFGRVLDWSHGGHFQISTVEPATATRRYLPGTNILETQFETSTGRLTLTDCLAIHEGSQADDAEAVDPYRQLVRLVRCDAGQVTVHVEFRPRFDYGLTTPQLIRVAPELATVYGGADALLVQSDLPGERTDLAGFSGDRTLSSGERAYAVVTYARPHE